MTPSIRPPLGVRVDLGVENGHASRNLSPYSYLAPFWHIAHLLQTDGQTDIVLLAIPKYNGENCERCNSQTSQLA